MRIKKLLRTLALALCGVSLAWTGGCLGCGGQTDDPYTQKPEFALESGFYDSTSYDEYFVAYSSDKTEFDLDDVTLTFYYGYVNEAGFHPENSGIDVIFCYFNGDVGIGGGEATRKEYFTVLTAIFPEEFYTSEYQVTCNKNGRLSFNKSCVLTIPRKFFCKEKGHLSFSLMAIGISRFADRDELLRPDKYDTLYDFFRAACDNWGSFYSENANIYYRMVGDRVILSDKEFK